MGALVFALIVLARGGDVRYSSETDESEWTDGRLQRMKRAVDLEPHPVHEDWTVFYTNITRMVFRHGFSQSNIDNVAKKYWEMQGMGSLTAIARQMAEVAAELQQVRFSTFWLQTARKMQLPAYKANIRSCVARACKHMANKRKGTASCSLMCQHQITNPCLKERIPR